MSILLIGLALGATTPQGTAELDYRPGQLAYGALLSGDLDGAGKQLEASKAEYRDDPAWLLNFGN